jgi:hypothetical protein
MPVFVECGVSWTVVAVPGVAVGDIVQIFRNGRQGAEVLKATYGLPMNHVARLDSSTFFR